MKKGKSNTTGLLIMLVLVVTIFYLVTKLQDPKVIKVPVHTPMIPPRRPIASVRRAPEYRDPPIKMYNSRGSDILCAGNDRGKRLYG